MNLRIGLLVLIGMSVTMLTFQAFASASHWLPGMYIPVLLGGAVALCAWLLVLLRLRGASFGLTMLRSTSSLVVIVSTLVFLLPRLPEGSVTVMTAAAVATFCAILFKASREIGLDRHPRW